MLRSGRICVLSTIHHQITELFLSFNKTGEQLVFIFQVCCFQDSTQLPRFHFLHLLMCSFLILAHLNKQRADWPVSVPVQQFPSALFFTILNHSWLDQVGRMTERGEIIHHYCLFISEGKHPPLNPQGNKGGLLLKHCEDGIFLSSSTLIWSYFM